MLFSTRNIDFTEFLRKNEDSKFIVWFPHRKLLRLTYLPLFGKTFVKSTLLLMKLLELIWWNFFQWEWIHHFSHCDFHTVLIRVAEKIREMKWKPNKNVNSKVKFIFFCYKIRVIKTLDFGLLYVPILKNEILPMQILQGYWFHEFFS